MVEARPGGPGDASELVRLRGLMLAATPGGEPLPGRWQQDSEVTLVEELGAPSARWGAFVVDHPAHDGRLAACAVGVVERMLGSPSNPSGLVGHVFNVATEPAMQRRGYSRACMEALLDWFRCREVTNVHLLATPVGEPLYRTLGFARTSSPAMSLTLPSGGTVEMSDL